MKFQICKFGKPIIEALKLINVFVLFGFFLSSKAIFAYGFWMISFPVWACHFMIVSGPLLKRFFRFLVIVGACLNGMVVLCNGGKMPVMDTHTIKVDLPDFHHIAINANTHLALLCDRLPWGIGIWSIGDCLIFIGSFACLLFFLWEKRKPKNKSQEPTASA